MQASWLDVAGRLPGPEIDLSEFIMGTHTMARCAWLLILLAPVFSAGCSDDKRAPTAAQGMSVKPTDSQTVPTFVGIKPAMPTTQDGATTPTANSDLSAMQRSASMPMPGQANDHSTLSPQLKAPARH